MSESIIVMIVATLFIIITLIIVLVALKKSRQRKQKLDSDAIKKGETGGGTVNGIDYTFRHFRGTHQVPPSFSVTVECPEGYAFKITKETAFDRFFKRLGLAVEVTTHDPSFDDNYYIAADNSMFAREYFGKSEHRRIIDKLFQAGFNQLQLKGRKLTALWMPYRLKTPPTREEVDEIAASLGTLREKIPTMPPEQPPGIPVWKFKRAVAFTVSILAVVTGLISMMTGLLEYTPLDGGTMFLDSLKYSLPLLVLFIYATIRMIRGRSASHREFVAIAVIALIGFPLAGFGYEATFNGVLDQSEPRHHEVLIIKKFISRSKNSKSYYLVVESWRKGTQTEKLKSNFRTYQKVTVNESRAIVVTKPGKFNFEWLESYRIETNR
jgi:hypothetical protein